MITGYLFTIPEEDYNVFNFNQNERIGVAMINKNLRGFEPRDVFSWHCSLTIYLEDCNDKDLPTKDEVKVINEFCDFLDRNIKGPYKRRPNAVFLGRVTWNKTREIIWRVNDPEEVHDFLQRVIAHNRNDREFDFSIEDDPNWYKTEWHLR